MSNIYDGNKCLTDLALKQSSEHALMKTPTGNKVESNLHTIASADVS